ncbi:MAG: hypothetical protein V7631_4296 [Massilia sp.]
MAHLLSVLFLFLRRKLLLFASIVLVLVLAPWIGREWRNIQRIADEVPALQRALEDVGARQAARADELARRLGQLSGAPLRRLDAEILALDTEIGRLQREQQREPGAILADAVTGSGSVAARLRESALRGVEIELRRQAREHLLVLRAHALVLGDRQAALAKAGQLRLAHVNAYAAWLRAHRQRVQFQDQAGWFARLRLTPSYAQLETLRKVESDLLAANNRAHRAFQAQQALLTRLSVPAAPAAFRVDERRLAQASAALRERLLQAERLAAQNLLWQGYLAVRPVLPVALGVLLGWWLVPAAIRTVFYFVLAPQAARRPPVVIGQADGSDPVVSTRQPGRDGARISARTSARISAVSQRVTLAPGQEMLIRPDYCQSQPAGASVATRLLFDWRHPLTSIAAHLWMLKRLRTRQEAEIVVSSTADPLDEVALVEIAPGEALVLQPRGLVGVLYEAGRPPTIRSHWRLGTLHAWLTLQLRYLAFEGPATLIVKGCRGVRLEGAAAGRTISQEATLGFSANARYATVRAEPFLPYLRGVQPLFHDTFDGQNAWYLYEEVPRNARANRHRSNPLELLVDAGLKAFGI